jgi:hypothetical protein
MLLRLKFTNESAMWHALRNYFWNTQWDSEKEPRMTNLRVNLTAYNRSTMVGYKAESFEIRIEVTEEPDNKTFFRFDGCLSWTIKPEVLLHKYAGAA